MADSGIGDIGKITGLPNEYLDKISKLVGAPSYAFQVMDRSGDIFLIHQNDNDDTYSHLRGIVIDIKREAIIARGSQTLTDCVCDKLVTTNDQLEVVDTNNISHILNKWKVLPGFEGMIVRVFKSGGKVFYITHKTLDFHNKKWGIDKMFGDMWEGLNGPKDEDLFGDEENGGYYYQFLLVHKYLQVGSRFSSMNPGFIVLMGKHRTCYEETETSLDVKSFTLSKDIDEPFITGVNPFSDINEANNYLRHGLHKNLEQPDDVRLRTGEFVILSCEETGKILRVMSPGFHYRISIRNNKAHIRDRFLELFQDVYRDKLLLEEEGFTKRFVALRSFESPTIVPELFTGIKWPLSKDMALRLVFRCFLASIPPSLQSDYSGLLKDFFGVRKDVVKWINDLCFSKTPYHVLNGYHKRIYTIISQSRKYTKNGGHSGKYYNDELKMNIKFMIDNEYPFSLYRIHAILKDKFPSNKSNDIIKFVYADGKKYN